jgi:hypothetical protein
VWIGTFTDSQRNTLSADGVVPRAVISSGYARFLGAASVTNGINTVYPERNGQPGTVVFLSMPTPAGTLILIR